MKVVASVAALALGLGVLGCGHGDADGDRRLTQLREELARVQADRDRVDQRLMALETKPAPPPSASAVAPARPESIETPRLRVVKLGPELGTPTESTSAEETASSIDDDGSARAVIRVTGNARARGRTGDRGAKADVIMETLPDESAAVVPGNASAGSAPIRERAPRPSALDPDARRAYDDAYALVQSHKCQQALDAFAGFIMRWPDHPNADNALYWRGECYAQLGDLPRAVEQFEGTIARFPLGNKVPDALLKLGISHTKLGNQARAKEAFERLEREYPRSEARRRIPQGAAIKP